MPGMNYGGYVPQVTDTTQGSWSDFISDSHTKILPYHPEPVETPEQKVSRLRQEIKNLEAEIRRLDIWVDQPCLWVWDVWEDRAHEVFLKEIRSAALSGMSRCEFLRATR